MKKTVMNEAFLKSKYYLNQSYKTVTVLSLTRYYFIDFFTFSSHLFLFFFLKMLYHLSNLSSFLQSHHDDHQTK